MKIELKGRIGADNAAALEQELMEQLDRKPD